MKYKIHYHNHADSIIQSKTLFRDIFSEITSSIEMMTDEALIKEHKNVQEKRPKVKSLSEAINNIIRTAMVAQSWQKEAGIFKEAPYNDSNNKKWRLDFAKHPISLEIAFNHGEAVAHNILKPVLASQLNHIQKDIQTEMAVIVTTTDELKDKGNFDGAVGTYEKYIEYLKPYSAIISIPIVIIGLMPPERFYIDKKSRKIIV